MADQPMTLFQNIMEAILTTPGDTTQELRNALVQHTAQLCNAANPSEINIPSELENYVKKVALHAYQVTDQDIAQLHSHGLSEDAIFEITLSVASGASMNCLTQGLAAIEGAKNALEKH